MTAIRFQIIDPDGVVQVDDAMRSAPEHTTPDVDAARIAADFETGWTVRLWKDIDLVRPLAAQGEPHAVAVHP